jgi:dipeptidyl aminopeptidase/acylaminoacyl peptidase
MAMPSRWVLGSLSAIAAIATLLFVLAGVVLCESAVRVPRHSLPLVPFAYDPAVHWRPVQIAATDGVVLRAWLPEGGSGNCILALHGIGDSRVGQLGLTRLFLNNGYTVLAPDSRGHGESGGGLVTYGLREADDVHRWVSWLIGSEHPRNVFGVGESLGAAVLLQSLALDSRFSAVVAECPFANLERIAEDRVLQRLPPPLQTPRVAVVPVVWAGFLYARLRYGLDFRDASPESALAKATTPVLLIHGLKDTNTPPVHSEILAAKNVQNVTLWLVPGAGHTAAFGTAPQEFRKRVLGFLADHSR